MGETFPRKRSGVAQPRTFVVYPTGFFRENAVVCHDRLLCSARIRRGSAVCPSASSLAGSRFSPTFFSWLCVRACACWLLCQGRPSFLHVRGVSDERLTSARPCRDRPCPRGDRHRAACVERVWPRSSLSRRKVIARIAAVSSPLPGMEEICFSPVLNTPAVFLDLDCFCFVLNTRPKAGNV